MSGSFQSRATVEQVDALLEGGLEVGIITMPVHNESLRVEQILRESLVAALSKVDALSNSPPLRISQLSSVPLISRARRLNPQSYDHPLKSLRKAGYTPPSVVEVTNDVEALHLVSEGLGLSFIKISAVPFHMDEALIFQSTDANLFEDTGHANRRSNRSKTLRTFLEMMRDHRNEFSKHALQHLL